MAADEMASGGTGNIEYVPFSVITTNGCSVFIYSFPHDFLEFQQSRRSISIRARNSKGFFFGA